MRPSSPRVAALVLVAACQSMPPVGVATPFGVARAGSREEAAQLASRLQRYAPQVRALVPDALGRLPEVWLQDFTRLDGLAHRPEVMGLALPGSGRIRIREGGQDGERDLVLVHELVHALLGPDWTPLPAQLKEGVCDVVATHLVPQAAPELAGLRLLGAASVAPGMALEISWFPPEGGRRDRLPFRVGVDAAVQLAAALGRPGTGRLLGDDDLLDAALYGWGWVLADRAFARSGLHGLHALCLEAAAAGRDVVPLGAVLDAADLAPDDLGTPGALVARIGESELAVQCELMAAELAVVIAVSLAARYPAALHPDLDPEEVLARALPTLGWVGGRARVGLDVVPVLRDRVVAALGAARGDREGGTAAPTSADTDSTRRGPSRFTPRR